MGRSSRASVGPVVTRPEANALHVCTPSPENSFLKINFPDYKKSGMPLCLRVGAMLVSIVASLLVTIPVTALHWRGVKVINHHHCIGVTKNK